MTTLQELLADPETSFEMENRHEVMAFIDANPFLAPLIEEAIPHIRKCFGSQTPLALEVFSESDDPAEASLFLKILATAPIGDAVKKLNALDAGWWLSNSHRAGGKLHITLFTRRPTEHERV